MRSASTRSSVKNPPASHRGFISCGVFHVGKREKGVDPTRLELVTSAMRRRRRGVLGVSRRLKIPLSRPYSRISGFPLFTGVCLGNCQISVKVLSYPEGTVGALSNAQSILEGALWGVPVERAKSAA